jgi:hypothetical protein
MTMGRRTYHYIIGILSILTAIALAVQGIRRHPAADKQHERRSADEHEGDEGNQVAEQDNRHQAAALADTSTTRGIAAEDLPASDRKALGQANRLQAQDPIDIQRITNDLGSLSRRASKIEAQHIAGLKVEP